MCIKFINVNYYWNCFIMLSFSSMINKNIVAYYNFFYNRVKIIALYFLGRFIGQTIVQLIKFQTLPHYTISCILGSLLYIIIGWYLDYNDYKKTLHSNLDA